MDNFRSNSFLRSREGVLTVAALAVLLAAPLVAQAVGQTYFISLASRVAILALAGVGLNLALGTGGMISFGHAAFFGLGGYVAGAMVFHAQEGGQFLGLLDGTQQALLSWPLALGVAGLAALLIGLISLRTSGVYFIMITLAFAQMFYYLALSFPTYGGEDGMTLYERSTLGGLSVSGDLPFFFVCFVALLLALGLCARLIGSRFGAALMTARQNETRLATVGINPFPVKLTGFVISAMITALAGVLLVEQNGFASPSLLSWHRSGEIMIFVILGGVGRLIGPVLGAAVFILLETVIGGYTDRWQLLLGLVLLGIVLFARGGLVGLLAGRARHD